MPPKGTPKKNGTPARSEADKTPPRKRPNKKKAGPMEENVRGAMTEAKRAQKKNKATAKVQKKDAQKHLSDREERILKLMMMTETEAWQMFYRVLVAREKKAVEALRTVEKTRDILRAQELVKLLSGKDGILEEIHRPIRLFNDFPEDMPLFKSLAKYKAVFNEATGIVSLEPISKPAKKKKAKSDGKDVKKK